MPRSRQHSPALVPRLPLSLSLALSHSAPLPCQCAPLRLLCARCPNPLSLPASLSPPVAATPHCTALHSHPPQPEAAGAEAPRRQGEAERTLRLQRCAAPARHRACRAACCITPLLWSPQLLCTAAAAAAAHALCLLGGGELCDGEAGVQPWAAWGGAPRAAAAARALHGEGALGQARRGVLLLRRSGLQRGGAGRVA